MSREYPCVYYDNQKCTFYSDPEYTDWCVLGPCSHETPSNADQIRAMSDEELAELLHKTESRKGYTDLDGWLSWVQQPYEEET